MPNLRALWQQQNMKNSAENADLFGAMMKSGYQGELEKQRQAEKLAQDKELTGRKLDIDDRFRRDQARHMERQDRAMALEQFLKGSGSAKPLSVEQERAQMLANEGLQTSQNLQTDTSQNPLSAKAVMAAEKLRSVPMVGGLLGDAVSGIAALVNPKAKDIEANRDKLARDMLYLKSGANATEAEMAGMKRQLPSITSGGEQQKDIYSSFTKPFKDYQAMHERGPSAQIPAEDMSKYIMQGGAMPQPKQAASSPDLNAIMQKIQALEAKKAGAGK